MIFSYLICSDDSLGYEYPFLLKVVQKGGSWCAWCPWHRFCRGCTLPCTSDEFSFAASNLAIDWDQTALHLRYLSAEEKVITAACVLYGYSVFAMCTRSFLLYLVRKLLKFYIALQYN